MRFTFAVSLALLFLAAPTRAEDTPPYVVGDLIDAIALEDQHGDPGAVDASTRVVLFSRDMDGGDLLQEALAEASADTRAARGALDIVNQRRFVASRKKRIAGKHTNFSVSVWLFQHKDRCDPALLQYAKAGYISPDDLTATMILS